MQMVPHHDFSVPAVVSVGSRFVCRLHAHGDAQWDGGNSAIQNHMHVAAAVSHYDYGLRASNQTRSPKHRQTLRDAEGRAGTMALCAAGGMVLR